MLTTPLTTPCPVAVGASKLPFPTKDRRLSSSTSKDYTDETLTSNLEYTRALPSTLVNVRPRRKSTFDRKVAAKASITIFEDVPEEGDLVLESRLEKTEAVQGKTLLGKLAVRNPRRRSQSGVEERAWESDRRRSIVQLQPEVRGSFCDHSVDQKDGEYKCGTASNSLSVVDNHFAIESKTRSGLTKAPRRRTIYVPSEDTTILTIHPGGNSTHRIEDTFHQPKSSSLQNREQLQTNLTAAKPVRPRASLAAAPVRAPLQQTGTVQGNVSALDRPGVNGGKENLLPSRRIEKTGLDALLEDFDNVIKPPMIEVEQPRITSAPRRRTSIAPQKVSPVRIAPMQTVAAHVKQARASVRFGLSGTNTNSLHQTVEQCSRTQRAYPVTALKSSGTRAAPAQNPQRRARPSHLGQYPILTEDLAQPELYEDEWISHQEVALTEVINSIFSRGKTSQGALKPRDNLRSRMIDLYHQPRVTMLHQRLQASLDFGALSRPREAPAAAHPALDIGLRKRFLRFWLDAYDFHALKAAAEVVFGRQLGLQQEPPSSTTDQAITQKLDPHGSRRKLAGFLETFLVDCDDIERVEQPSEPNSFEQARWKKTVLRSLMMIWLLDASKNSGAVEGCLLLPNAAFKSSNSALRALSSLITSPVGDIVRTLRYLDFNVSLVQNPLDEISYTISNIAIDMRDGIFLTRLVELLLFPKRNNAAKERTSDSTVTIQLPDCTILESLQPSSDVASNTHVLSQHLSVPASSRAQKMYNVQIALSALHDHGQLGTASSDVAVQDIVDGHREKTLGLLWQLVGAYAFEQVVDWKALVSDIQTCSSTASTTTFAAEKWSSGCQQPLSQSDQESLLKAWASTHCSKHGFRMSNLTTSFADSTAYTLIVGDFIQYVDGIASPSSLETQLKSLGCSKEYIKQLVHRQGTIPSRKTTITNLAFLASRLLPLASRHRCAITIQRFYRLRLQKRQVSKRIALMRLAHGCALVVQTQQKIEQAAVVLQRAWRKVVDTRVDRLSRDVVVFQSRARAWLARSTVVQRSSYTSGLATRPTLRVVGGW